MINHPKAVVVKKPNPNILQINEEDLVRVVDHQHIQYGELICTKVKGEFALHGYSLSPKVNWAIVQDSLGALILIATKKA